MPREGERFRNTQILKEAFLTNLCKDLEEENSLREKSTNRRRDRLKAKQIVTGTKKIKHKIRSILAGWVWLLRFQIWTRVYWLDWANAYSVLCSTPGWSKHRERERRGERERERDLKYKECFRDEKSEREMRRETQRRFWNFPFLDHCRKGEKWSQFFYATWCFIDNKRGILWIRICMKMMQIPLIGDK